MGHEQQIQFGAWFTANDWIAEKLGRGMPNPFQTSLDEAIEYNQARSRLLYQALGEFGQGSPDPQPWFAVPQHDGRLICATAFGAPYPVWDPASNSFWLDKSAHVWAGLSDPAEVARLPVPNWEENPLVQENVRAWEQVVDRVGRERASELSLDWTELDWTHPHSGRRYRFGVFPSFLDLGGFMVGSTRFLTLLLADPPLADALMQKCFEISASYGDYMCRLYDRPRQGWASMGGDNSCLVSPGTYRRYGLGFDLKVRAKCGYVPRNLHSCGPSKHLYPVWADYPEREQIVLLQTRAIPGVMGPLRSALPHTYIQLTIHRPQVDFERESPERVKALVWELAEAMHLRDARITVIFSAVDERCKDNLRAFYQAAAEVNAGEQRARS